MVEKKVIWRQRQGLLRNRLRNSQNVLRRDDGKDEIFKIAKHMARTNQDVVGDKCIRNDHGDLAFEDCSKEKPWEN